MNMNIDEAINEDHRLSIVADSAQIELARHRWHWTLDQSNPERRSMREWASLVGVTFPAVRNMVKGYELWGDQPGLSLTDCIRLANMSSDRRNIALELAQRTGRSVNALANDGSISAAYWDSVESDSELAEQVAETLTDTPYRQCQTSSARIFAEVTFVRQKSREIVDNDEREKLATEVALKAELMVSLVDFIRGANIDDELRALVDDD